jgi:diguanylate cyclase (GGDEF)-like protein
VDICALAWLDLWSVQIPAPVTLAAICVVGYLFGRHWAKAEEDNSTARREVKRAKAVASELEKIAELLRRDLASHHASIARFKDKITNLGASRDDASWQDLCREAEEILRPTLRLASQLSSAYDEIRQQTNHLMTFTEVRTDSLTGVSNRRALDETLENMFALQSRYEHPFSLAIFDIDHFKQVNDENGHLFGDQALKDVARLIDDTIRETDIVFRYGGEEFVVVMPNTPLSGACIFADRLRAQIQEKLQLTVSGGVASARETDDPQSLLSRADAALYSAKAAGRNQTFHHDGETIAPSVELTPAPVAATA